MILWRSETRVPRAILCVASAGLALFLLFAAPACFYSHPVVGIFPGEEATDDTTGLLLGILGGGSGFIPSPDGGSSGPTGPVLILFTGANTTGDLRNGQATARLGANLHC